MSLFVLIPTDENGNLLDKNFDTNIQTAMGASLGFTDVFIYSHGWWTSAVRAAETYNRFSIEFANSLKAIQSAGPIALISPGSNAFGIGIHWPSMLSEDQRDIVNYLEAISFFGMATRANAVGSNGVYVLLRLLLQARAQSSAPLRIHLIGHSFGCKVVCMALQRLVEKGLGSLITPNISIDAVLLQAAFNDDELDQSSTSDYSDVTALIPRLRLLITTSAFDRALGVQYARAQRFANFLHREGPSALGFTGPTAQLDLQLGGRVDVSVTKEFSIATVSSFQDKRLVVADLSPIHEGSEEDENFVQVERPERFELDFAGHHSDIFREQIYQLLAAFFFK